MGVPFGGLQDEHGFTHKKLQHVAKQRSLVYHQMCDRDYFVFIDEMGCSSQDHTRKLNLDIL